MKQKKVKRKGSIGGGGLRLGGLPPFYVRLRSRRAVDSRCMVFEGAPEGPAEKLLLTMLRSQKKESYRYIWACAPGERCSSALTGLATEGRLCLVQRESREYCRALASAGQIISERALPSFFVRKEGQQYLRLFLEERGDGAGYLVQDESSAKEGRSATERQQSAAERFDLAFELRDLLQTTHLVTRGEKETKRLAERCQLAGIYEGCVLEADSEAMGWDDGLAAFLSGKEGGVRERRFPATARKKLLISTGLALQNGITHSYLSLLKHLDYDALDVTAYVYAPRDTDQAARILTIPEEVRLLLREAEAPAILWERLRLGAAVFFRLRGVMGRLVPEGFLQREVKRTVGGAAFDAVVEFNGYSPLLALLLPRIPAKTHAIWMHNDIKAELTQKKSMRRKLGTVIETYSQWDRMVSCSPSLQEVNRKNLGSPATRERFFGAKNTIDESRVYEGAEEKWEVEGLPFPNAAAVNFVTMGRFSEEKNQLRLIRAFGRYEKSHGNSRLYLIGEGPLRGELEEEIRRQGLVGKAILTGNLENPFGLMKACDCFVLPSLHEGQPLVLLEARMLGLPILVSDFSSVRDSLMEGGQYLIQPTEDGILEGLEAFREGRVPTCPFDAAAYNQEAVQAFEKTAGLRE